MTERKKYLENLLFLLDKWIAEFDKIEAAIRKTYADPNVDKDEAMTALRQRR
jgi:hypothetical protein